MVGRGLERTPRVESQTSANARLVRIKSRVAIRAAESHSVVALTAATIRDDAPQLGLLPQAYQAFLRSGYHGDGDQEEKLYVDTSGISRQRRARSLESAGAPVSIALYVGLVSLLDLCKARTQDSNLCIMLGTYVAVEACF